MPDQPTFRLDRNAPGSLVETLKGEIHRRLRRGLLRPGDRLPPSRRLAREMGVSRGTVTTAYEDLRAAGTLSGHVGRGTFVAADLPVVHAPRHEEFGFRWREHFAGIEPPREPEDLRAAAALAGPDAISFAGGVPDETLFPTDAFRAALDGALAAEGSSLLAYGTPRGQAGFVAFLLGYLAEMGVVVDEEELLVVNGSQQALDLIGRAFLRPGDTVAVEEPTYFGALDLFRGFGVRLVGVPVDEDGVRPDALEAVLSRERPKLVYVMPSFQNPTGACLSEERRDAVVRLSARYEVPLVEDDFDGELWFDEPPPAPLVSRREAAGVLYVGTPSKMLFPGLRIGWIAAPAPVVERLGRIRRIADLSGSPLLQAALARFARDGGLRRHVPVVRGAYGERMRRLSAALAREMPEGVTFTRPRGGLSLLVTLPEGIDASAMLPDAARAGVLYSPGRLFFPEGGVSSLRLSIGSVHPERVEEGVRRLALVVRSAVAAGPRPSVPPGLPPV